jgi:hypothetical protein
MKTLLHITAQVHENYGGNTWKPKGGFMFTLRVESFAFMYMEAECIEAVQMLLDEQSNEHERFTYVSHELIFNEPKELDSDVFEAFLLAKRIRQN